MEVIFFMPNELIDEIIKVVRDNSNDNPAPKKGKVNKIHENGFIDVRLDDETVLKHIECLGNPRLNNTCIICFVDGDSSNIIAIG